MTLLLIYGITEMSANVMLHTEDGKHSTIWIPSQQDVPWGKNVVEFDQFHKLTAHSATENMYGIKL
jgi:hypothetical protein